ncbi:MAG: hypothetical protein AUG06_00020 [Actinobacteria bacterium 13_1_20CM_2_65_11]|nr:MAG: hypothetical protein AUG06_00020 [Actinobacteria bacterium 13_1_20CM_2_65_11]
MNFPRAAQDAKRGIQDDEQGKTYQRRRSYVPRPWAHHVQWGGAGGLGAKVHVVGTRRGVDQADRGRIGQRQTGEPQECVAARPLPESNDQEERRGHHAAMRHVVLNEGKARKVMGQIGGDDRLDGSRQTPEIRHLDEQLPPQPQRQRRHDDRGVAELQRERVGELSSVGVGGDQKYPPPDLSADQYHGESARGGDRPSPWPQPRACYERRRRYCNDGHRAHVFGREQSSHRGEGTRIAEIGTLRNQLARIGR